jgi:hypothetical protein
MYRTKLVSFGKTACAFVVPVILAIPSQGTSAAIDIRTIALVGDAVPGTPAGTTFILFANGSSPVISNSGRVAFHGKALGFVPGPFVSSGIWTDANGGLELVAIEGNNAPGTEVGVDYHTIGQPQLDAVGHLSFRSVLTGPSVDLSNNLGIWSDIGAGLELIVREGSQVPGMTEGVLFERVAQHRTNAAGQTMFDAVVAGPGIDFTNNTGTWIYDSGALAKHRPGIDPPIHTLFPGYGPALTVQEGDLAPGITPVVEFLRIDGPVTNRAGQTLFRAFLAEPGVGFGSNTSLWLEDSSGLRLIAREDEPAPGMEPGVSFNTIDQFNSLNTNGLSAFKADVVGPGIHGENNRGIWVDTNWNLELIVRSGTQAPGTNPGVDFFSFEAIGLNDRGALAFSGTLTGGGVDSTNDRGIWLNADGVLQLIIREGDPLEVAPGDIRTISSFTFDPTNEDNGVLSGFNDSSSLTFAATFTDGSIGVFVATPEPTTALLCMGGITPYLLARRRNAG